MNLTERERKKEVGKNFAVCVPERKEKKGYLFIRALRPAIGGRDRKKKKKKKNKRKVPQKPTSIVKRERGRRKTLVFFTDGGRKKKKKKKEKEKIAFHVGLNRDEKKSGPLPL